MLSAHRAEDVRRAEEARMAELELLGRDPGELMQTAAAAVAATALRMLPRRYGARVLVLAGSGNNGGDALFAGARLRARGVEVWVGATSDRGLHAGGERACRRAGARFLSRDELVPALTGGRLDLVVDGVLGLGSRGGLPDDVAVLADALGEPGAPPVLAVDLPSGLQADASRVDRSFRAARTVTFGTSRIAHLTSPARERCGAVEVVDLGLTLPAPALRQWQAVDVAAAYPVPGPTDHKYTRGVVGLDTGSEQYPGAALLGVLGAVHGGAGMVRYLGSATVTTEVPNVVTADGRVQALVLGSGWGSGEDAEDRLRQAFHRVAGEGSALLLDADALAVLPAALDGGSGERPAPHRWLLTPHAGELTRLLQRDVDRGWVESHPDEAAQEAADRYRATVLLKGGTQYVARPRPDDGTDVPPVDLAVPGPAWTGQAGSGDVLAGLCGALLAAGLPAGDAAVVGASLQALAAARR
ncbi:bifunctional ADP-dependent NAD(P)H-hydrate dehydratase/NAD(P)H-hydrate epimerase, partial [Desertihabitans aurantiacus]|uniref:bifunctional ADP-dependent NAD(P)H-hydrate dehydratase/NAD(P)H-hydrate epimerase n=1 Tax=Desertihabitans aurantiacus TaxID=2282477 RepID=UPI0013004CB7